MSLTRFIFAVHCHQPVGNFSWVLEEAYASAYLPFLEAVERHPKIRIIFHYSGNLLDWFEAEHPDFLKRLSILVRGGQADVLGGGYYEPIVPVIPEEDALGQLQMMNHALIRLGLTRKNRKGRAEGAWLSERVWEPTVPSLFAQAGIRYTIVDDHHLALAGIPEAERFGYYLTEDQGMSVATFPSLKTLRYLVPFKPVEEVVASLRRLSSDRPRAVVLADDGEKFGLWPGTHKWVYEEGWLENFFQALERNEDWLKLTTFQECLDTLPPLGRVNLPCSSYEEMNGWSGGLFRNFLLKYPEAETLQKKMLWVSERLRQLHEEGGTHPRTKTLLSEARRFLYRGQSNDAYWHGIFGGLYLRHLRRSVYQNLLRAEQLLDQAQGRRSWLESQWRDMDGDQVPELLMRSAQLTLLFDVQGGGQALELSDKITGFNLLDTLMRRAEPYHQQIENASHAAGSSSGTQPAGDSKETLPTIHERKETLHPDWKGLLVYDSYRRAGFVDHLFSLQGDVHDFAQGRLEELGDFVTGAYTPRLEKTKKAIRATFNRRGSVRNGEVLHSLNITKRIEINSTDRLLAISYRLVNLERRPLHVLFGSELNVALKDAHVNRVGQAHGIQRFALVDPSEHLQIRWVFNRQTDLWYFPIETFSDSDRGIERTYQGVSLTFLWPMELAPKASWTVAWTFGIESPPTVSETLSLKSPHRERSRRGTARKTMMLAQG